MQTCMLLLRRPRRLPSPCSTALLLGPSRAMYAQPCRPSSAQYTAIPALRNIVQPYLCRFVAMSRLCAAHAATLPGSALCSSGEGLGRCQRDHTRRRACCNWAEAEGGLVAAAVSISPAHRSDDPV